MTIMDKKGVQKIKPAEGECFNTHFGGGVACSRHKSSVVRRQGERHDVTSVSVVGSRLLSRFDVPEGTANTSSTLLQWGTSSQSK